MTDYKPGDLVHDEDFGFGFYVRPLGRGMHAVLFGDDGLPDELTCRDGLLVKVTGANATGLVLQEEARQR